MDTGFTGNLLPEEFTVQVPNIMWKQSTWEQIYKKWLIQEKRWREHRGQAPLLEDTNSTDKANLSAHILKFCMGNSSYFKAISILCLKLIPLSFQLSIWQSEGAQVRMEQSPVKGMYRYVGIYVHVCVQPGRALQYKLSEKKKNIWGYT